jgi:hypothetical protein
MALCFTAKCGFRHGVIHKAVGHSESFITPGIRHCCKATGSPEWRSVTTFQKHSHNLIEAMAAMSFPELCGSAVADYSLTGSQPFLLQCCCVFLHTPGMVWLFLQSFLRTIHQAHICILNNGQTMCNQ